MCAVQYDRCSVKLRSNNKKTKQTNKQTSKQANKQTNKRCPVRAQHRHAKGNTGGTANTTLAHRGIQPTSQPAHAHTHLPQHGLEQHRVQQRVVERRGLAVLQLRAAGRMKGVVPVVVPVCARGCFCARACRSRGECKSRALGVASGCGRGVGKDGEEGEVDSVHMRFLPNNDHI